jgi:hypothetical protein
MVLYALVTLCSLVGGAISFPLLVQGSKAKQGETGKIITQRRRYTKVTIACVVSMTSLLVPACYGGIPATLHAINKLSVDPTLGVLIECSVIVHALVPVFAAIASCCIYRRPMKYARELRGLYMLTSEVRRPENGVNLYNGAGNRVEVTSAVL